LDLPAAFNGAPVLIVQLRRSTNLPLSEFRHAVDEASIELP
jgi:hypothetical protein